MEDSQCILMQFSVGCAQLPWGNTEGLASESFNINATGWRREGGRGGGKRGGGRAW